MAYVDLVLIVVVYFALQREPLNALFIAAIAGLATDALSRGLLGASGFFMRCSERGLRFFVLTRFRSRSNFPSLTLTFGNVLFFI